MAENNGEFIDRENQLPPDPAAENVYGAGLGQKGEAADRAPLVSPPVDYDVRSIYDSRPINGYDFNVISSILVGTTATPDFLVQFTVRQGFVAVIREIHHFFDPIPPITKRNDVLLTLQRNNGDFPDNTSIPVGAFSDGIVKTFLLADEFDIVTAKVQYTAAALLAAPTTCYVQFYGNYLLKTGRPFMFEIANPSGRPAMVAPPRMPTTPKQITRTVPTITPPTASVPVPAAPMAPVPVTSKVPEIIIGFIKQQVLSSGGSKGGAKGPRYIPAKDVNGKLKPLNASELVRYANEIQQAARASGIQPSM